MEHECAHSFAARRAGFTLDKIVLMPYGAALSGDIEGISPKQELAVCLAGPLANAVTALGFVALWWLYPETYPYTDAAYYVSLSLFLVNLLPAWPLDGGRILKIALRRLGAARALRVSRIVGFLVAAAILGWFVYSCFSKPNWSALFFSLCLAAGGFGGGNYGRITFSRKKSFARGIEETRVAISADCTLAEALRFLREDKYLVFELFDGEEFFGELPEEEFKKALEHGELTRRLGETLSAGSKILEN